MHSLQGSNTAPSFLSFSSRDPDLASERLRQIYVEAIHVEPVARRPAFSMRSSAAKGGDLTLIRHEVRNWTLIRDIRDAVIVFVPETSPMTLRSGGSLGVYDPGKTFAVARPFERHRIAVDHGVGLAMTASVEGLRLRIERATGRPCEAATLSRMVDQIDAASPIAQALARSAKTALAEMAGLHRLGLGGVTTTGYEELLLNMMAAALLPELAQPNANDVDIGTAAVRRAREFIREQCAETIEISRLAADLGVSMRALQQSFQRAYGFSPRDYLMECRLELARRYLLTPDPSRNIADIAFSSSFSDLSHFSAKYRDKYGELPSTTLRNAAL